VKEQSVVNVGSSGVHVTMEHVDLVDANAALRFGGGIACGWASSG